MKDLTDEEIYQEVSKVVSQFDILECDRCIQAVIEWLARQEIKGKILKLSTLYKGEDYIVSNRLGGNESITINGIHYGIKIRRRVFDNLSTEGMTREEWIEDFHCPSEQFILEELEEL